MNNSDSTSIMLFVVEDCETDREMYRRILSKSPGHYSFIETSNKEEAFTLYAKHKPDCLLIDYNLPGYTGVELLEGLMLQHPEDCIAAVILTGGGSEALARESLKAGAKDYLAKHEVSRESLRLTIDNAIQKSKLEKELRLKQRALEQALEKANAANAAKSQFLANMSHEIRTPLNGVLGFIDLVLEKIPVGEEREYLNLAKASADHLLNLINDILDFSKIEAGKMTLEKICFLPRDCFTNAINICKLKADEKEIRINLHIEDEIPLYCIGDPARLQQILINLVGNAIKFTPEQGRITIVAKLKEKNAGSITLEVSVSDTGIGIEKNKLDKIFDSFAQADSSTTRNYGGTGLGLSIVARLVKLMQGNVWVESAVDQGSTFYFSLKLTSTGEAYCKFVPGNQGETGNTTNSPLNIIVAEDNSVNQHLIKVILERAGHKVTISSNGRELLNTLGKSNFDVILMDIEMPVLDGVSATKEIRQIEQTTGAHIPIIALTANGLSGDRERYLACGMDGYVVKPLRKENLFFALAQVMGQSR